YLLSLPALLLFMVFLRSGLPGSAFDASCKHVCIDGNLAWLPLLIVTQMLFLMGLGFLLSALNVYFRDTSVLVEVALSAWFFLTPIIYDAREVAGQLANWMYYLNPMASLVANFREVFYYNDSASPDPAFMLRNLLFCTALLVGGYFFFMRLSHKF